MNVVAASVHHADFRAVRTFGFGVTGVGEAGLFFYGKSVHIGSNHDSGARAIAENGDDPIRPGARGFVLAEMVGDFVAEGAQFGGDDRGSFLFLSGELGMLVKMLVGGGKGVHLFGDALVEVGLGEDGHGSEKKENRKNDGTILEQRHDCALRAGVILALVESAGPRGRERENSSDIVAAVSIKKEIQPPSDLNPTWRGWRRVGSTTG